MYIVAFYLTYRLLRVLIAERGLGTDKETVLNLFFWGIIGVLVGGRLLSVIVYDPTGYYLRNPLQIIVPFVRQNGQWHFTGLQGMAYHGGLAGAMVSVALYCRAKKLPVAEWMDMIATCTPIGYAFGRLGNFINGELYGRVTSVPWGVVFPNAPRFSASEEWVRNLSTRSGIDISSEDVLVNLARHPSQLYEAILEGILLFFVLWFILRKRARFPGVLFSSYLIGYGVVRFAVEYLRQPDPGLDFPIKLMQVANPSEISLLNFTTGQILCAIMIVTGVLSLVVCGHRFSQAASGAVRYKREAPEKKRSHVNSGRRRPAAKRQTRRKSLSR